MSDRELTQEEIDLAPEWATNYHIHGSVMTPTMTSYYGQLKSFSIYCDGSTITQHNVKMHFKAKPIPRKKIDITEYEFSDTAIENVEGDKHHIIVANSEYTTQYTEEDIDVFKAHFVALRGGNHE